MRTAAVLLLTVALAGCSAAVEERPGNPDVYERIGGMEDCAELQREFDTADAHGGETSTAYMKAADERMREVGCY